MAMPVALIKVSDYKSLSVQAKILYSLMLDRLQLSVSRPEWIDEEGQPFIYYSVNEIANDLCCSKRKSNLILNELEVANLIRRQSQGCFATTRIYLSKLFA